MEFDALNLSLNLVNQVFPNFHTKAKAMGIKKTQNISKDNSSISQSPA